MYFAKSKAVLPALLFAFASALKGYHQAEFCVSYIDEHNPYPALGKYDSPGAVPTYRPLATKSLKYALQKEFRFIWYSVGSAAADAPDYVDIEAGPLRDIAKYYRLDPTTKKLIEVV